MLGTRRHLLHTSSTVGFIRGRLRLIMPKRGVSHDPRPASPLRRAHGLREAHAVQIIMRSSRRAGAGPLRTALAGEGCAMTIPKAPRISEAAILRSIMDYLAARHIFAMRLNSGVHFSESKGKRYMTRLSAPGTADILAFPMFSLSIICSSYLGTDHRVKAIIPLWLEIKAADGKQSELQKSFQAQVEAEGHRYAICRSIEDVEKALGVRGL